MAVKISDLPIITTATDDDYLPMVDPSSGQTRRILKSDLLKELRLGTDLAAQAVKANKADFSVADQTARDAFTPFDGLMVYRKDIDAIEIYDGGAWRRYSNWEILADVTLNTSASSISSGTFAGRGLLKISFYTPAGATLTNQLRFNNDSASNYSTNQKINDNAQVLLPSSSSIAHDPNNAAVPIWETFEIVNVAAQEKMVKINGMDNGASGAASMGNRWWCAGKWINTSVQITRADFLTSTNTFPAGTRMLVEGK